MEKILITILIGIFSISCSSLQYIDYEYEEDNIEKIDSISNSSQITDTLTNIKTKQKCSSNGTLYIMYNGRTYDISGRLIY